MFGSSHPGGLNAVFGDGSVKFVKFTMPDIEDPENVDLSAFKDAKHHRALAKVLEKVEKGHIPRLIVTLPPRHGKSELASRMFPAWHLGRCPDQPRWPKREQLGCSRPRTRTSGSPPAGSTATLTAPVS